MDALDILIVVAAAILVISLVTWLCNRGLSSDLLDFLDFDDG